MTSPSTTTTVTLEQIASGLADAKYMTLSRARKLQELIVEHDCKNLAEFGFYQGKGATFLAGILENLGRGHLTTFDKRHALALSPNIHDCLAKFDLTHRVTPVIAHRSFTWELAREIERDPTPRFDFAYIDGAHTWDGTGFTFFLVDALLKPGGIVVFDDLDWTLASSSGLRGRVSDAYDKEELNAAQVRKVWELLVPLRGYVDMREEKQFHWGIARKPL